MEDKEQREHKLEVMQNLEVQDEMVDYIEDPHEGRSIFIGGLLNRTLWEECGDMNLRNVHMRCDNDVNTGQIAW